MADFFTILDPSQLDAASLTGLSGTTAEVGTPLSNLLIDQPREIFKTDGTVSTVGGITFEIDFGQKITIDQIALLFHNGRRNGFIQVRTANTQAGLDSGSLLFLNQPLQTQLDQLFIERFLDVTNWTLSGGPSFTVTDRVATLEQVTGDENEDARLTAFSLPTTGIVMIDYLDDILKTGIIIGGATDGDTYIRRLVGSYQAITASTEALVENNSEAAFGKRWEFHLRPTDFDFLVDGKVVFLSLPRSGNELRLRNEAATPGVKSRYRLLQVFSNTINDSFERNHFFAKITPVEAKWAQVFIDHNNGADAFFSAGRILFGQAWTPSDNVKMEMGFSLGVLDASPRQIRRDRGIVVSSRPKPSRFQGNIVTRGALNEDSEPEIFDELDEIVRKRGGDKPILLTLEPASVLRRHKKLFYGLVESRLLQSTLATSSIKRYKYSLTVEEMT